jgi:hypothetical protein
LDSESQSMMNRRDAYSGLGLSGIRGWRSHGPGRRGPPKLRGHLHLPRGHYLQPVDSRTAPAGHIGSSDERSALSEALVAYRPLLSGIHGVLQPRAMTSAPRLLPRSTTAAVNSESFRESKMQKWGQRGTDSSRLVFRSAGFHCLVARPDARCSERTPSCARTEPKG